MTSAVSRIMGKKCKVGKLSENSGRERLDQEGEQKSSQALQAVRLTFVDETDEEQVVDVIISDSFRHFLEEIPRLSGSHWLQIDSSGAFVAKFCLWLE